MMSTSHSLDHTDILNSSTRTNKPTIMHLLVRSITFQCFIHACESSVAGKYLHQKEYCEWTTSGRHHNARLILRHRYGYEWKDGSTACNQWDSQTLDPGGHDGGCFCLFKLSPLSFNFDTMQRWEGCLQCLHGSLARPRRTWAGKDERQIGRCPLFGLCTIRWSCKQPFFTIEKPCSNHLHLGRYLYQIPLVCPNVDIFVLFCFFVGSYRGKFLEHNTWAR